MSGLHLLLSAATLVKVSVYCAIFAMAVRHRHTPGDSHLAVLTALLAGANVSV